MEFRYSIPYLSNVYHRWPHSELNCLTNVIVNFFSLYHCPSVRRLDSGNLAQSHSRLQLAALVLGRCGWCHTQIAVKWMDQVGRGSAMKMGSRSVMSAPSKSLKPPCGMSPLLAGKIGQDIKYIQLIAWPFIFPFLLKIMDKHIRFYHFKCMLD